MFKRRVFSLAATAVALATLWPAAQAQEAIKIGLTCR